MKAVVLITCSKSKREGTWQVREIYDTPKSKFRKRLSYAQTITTDDNIFVISAKHGLISLDAVIDWYDYTLMGKSKILKKEWAERVKEQISNLFDINNTKFIILAGKDYYAPLRSLLPNIELPLEGLSSGKSLAKLSELLNNTKQSEKFISAKDLRNNECLREIPSDKPGWYRWWVSEDNLELLLNSPHIRNKYLSAIMQYLTMKKFNGLTYYYIYTGIAVKEAIRDRLNWHVNQHHSKSSVESGFLSTLRQTISSLVAGNQYDEMATNNLIDTLIIEYYTVDFSVKSDEAKEKIEEIERKEMANNLLPLNIKDNKNQIVKPFLRELKEARKNSK